LHACDEEVQAPMGKWFQEQPAEFYSDSLKKWLRWQAVSNKKIVQK